MSDEELHEIEDVACPGAGACGGQFTANTMAMVLEFLGISPAGLNGIPARHPGRTRRPQRAGELVMELVRDDVRPRRSSRATALENAIACVAATGGSTNGVLHLLAIAREVGIPLDDRRVRRDRRPHADHRRPRSRAGRYVATDMLRSRRRRAGRARAVEARPDPRRRAERRRAARSAEIAAARSGDARPGGRRPDRASRSSQPAASRSCAATSRPEGCVVKLAGHERRYHAARRASSTPRRHASPRSKAGEIKPGDVVVIRYEGPAGGPGMREMLHVTAALVGEGLGERWR